jgi:hypothetical protein
MPCFWCPCRSGRQFPVESLIKIIGLSFHIFIEVVTGLHRGGEDHHLRVGYENSHHVIMISGFVLGAIIEILVYYGVPFPAKTEYMTTLLAFLIQFLIMTTHLTGDVGIEQIVHQLWTVLIFLTLIAACCEVYDPSNMWSVYMRIGFFLAQGTWLAQVAFVVWPKTTNPIYIWGTDHASHTWLSISLMCHLLLSLIILLGQYVLVYLFIEPFDRFYTRYEQEKASQTVRYGRLVEMKLNLNDDDDENIEYSALVYDQDSP